MVTCVKSLETASAFMRSLLVPGANRVTTTPAFWNDEVVIGIGIAAAFAPQCS